MSPRALELGDVSSISGSLAEGDQGGRGRSPWVRHMVDGPHDPLGDSSMLPLGWEDRELGREDRELGQHRNPSAQQLLGQGLA